MKPKRFGGHFTLLFDEQVDLPYELPEPFRDIYGGDLRLSSHPDRPYIYINFVTSRDGRISFAEPDHAGGGDVSGFSAADAWLMGLLRARADAVLVGDGTLRIEPGHLWTSEFIFPAEAEAFAALRKHFGLGPFPLQVILSLKGELQASAAIFKHADLQVIVATTVQGKVSVEALLQDSPAKVEVLALGDDSVNLHRLMTLLHTHYDVRSLLCEGGPRVYGSLLKAKLVDEEFLTLSPLAIGSEPDKPRPSLIEGATFLAGNAPRSKLISLRREGDHLFLRSRWTYPDLS